MRLRRLTLYFACLVLCVTHRAAADGVIRDSVGAVSSGRGGTNIAFSDNISILLNNPAGMANMKGRGMFGLGIDALITDLDYSDAANSEDAHFQLFGMPEAAYMRRSEDGVWAAGIGVYIPAGFGATWSMNSPDPIPGTTTYKSLGAMAKILPGVAVNVTDRLSIGATLGVAVSHAELEGPFFLQTGLLQGIPTKLDLQGTGATPTFTVGLQYQLTERTTFGAVYTSESRFQLDGSANVQVFGLAPFPLESRFDAETDLVWPRSVGVGLTHWLNDQHRVSGELIFTDWSHAFDRLDLTLSNPSNPFFNLLGPQITDSLPLKWKDSLSVRFGYEYFATPNDVFRTGYIYTSDSVPNSTLTPYIPAILEHTFSAGYGRTWGACSLDLAYQFAFGPTRNVGTSQIVGGDFVNSTFKSQAHWMMLTFTRRF